MRIQVINQGPLRGKTYTVDSKRKFKEKYSKDLYKINGVRVNSAELKRAWIDSNGLQGDYLILRPGSLASYLYPQTIKDKIFSFIRGLFNV